MTSVSPDAGAAGKPLADVLGNLAAALDDAKATLARMNGEIEELEIERSRIVQAPPHADDIAAVFQRGLEAANRGYLTRLGTHLNNRNWFSERGAAYVATSPAAGLLATATRPDPDALTPGGAGPNEPAVLDIGAVTYFLRDQIAAEIPALVERLCPAAKGGMKQADRSAALRDIDARLAPMREARDKAQADVALATRAVRR